MAAQSLFDIVYSGYSTPIEVAKVKADTDYQKVVTQTAQTELNEHNEAKQAMQSIWGQDAPGAAQGAMANPDAASMPKLMQTAQILFSKGLIDQGTKVLNAAALGQERTTQQQSAQAKLQQEKSTRVGGILGAVSDQDTYSAALQTLQDQGVDVGKLGLGPTYDSQTQAKVKYLSDSSMTHAQQVQTTEKARVDSERNSTTEARLALMGQQLNISKQRADAITQRANDYETNLKHSMSLKDRADARAQEALGFKESGGGGNSYIQMLKVQPYEAKAAQSVFATDDRTAQIPTTQRDGIALMAAQRTKRQLAEDNKKNGKNDGYEQEDYDSALEETMQRMESEGLFKPSVPAGGGIFGGDASYTHGKVPVVKGNAGTPPSKTTVVPAATSTQYTNLSSLQAAVKANKISRDDGIAIARKNGWIQ